MNPVIAIMSRERSKETGSKPLTPSLASKRIIRSPFTPKLAANNAQTSPPRPIRTPDNLPTSTDCRSPKDFVLPSTNLANSNITPRSSARKSRSTQVTPSGTPNGTPSHSRGGSTVDAFSAQMQVKHTSVPDSSATFTVLNGRPKSQNLGMKNPLGPHVRPALRKHASAVEDSAALKDRSPRYFYAKEAIAKKFSEPRAFMSKQDASFSYANGAQEPVIRPKEMTLSPALSPTYDMGAKFFHADGSAANMQMFSFTSPPVSVSSSRSSWLESPQLLESPVLSSPASASVTPLQTNVMDTRRLSLDKQALRSPQSHRLSISSATESTPRNLQRLQTTFLPTALDSTTPNGLCISPTKRRDIVPGDADEQSATKTDYLSDLVVQARRERKVLDLEISNSSLLAINRQLEREVRKQKTELRRFRRLTRSGRISITSAGTSRAFSLGTVPNENSDEDMESEEASGLFSDEEDDDITESPSESTSSNFGDFEVQTAKDARRLRLDLSKHKELLVDSQKLNQSIKKCLGLTEELMKEGKKALAYRVRVSDVHLGGHVLSPHLDEFPGTEPDYLGERTQPESGSWLTSEDENGFDHSTCNSTMITSPGAVDVQTVTAALTAPLGDFAAAATQLSI